MNPLWSRVTKVNVLANQNRYNYLFILSVFDNVLQRCKMLPESRKVLLCVCVCVCVCVCRASC